MWLPLLLAAPLLSCGGASGKGADGPSAIPPERETECCCQRYDDEGSPTAATISDTTACKSTGGTCTDDEMQCAED